MTNRVNSTAVLGYLKRAVEEQGADYVDPGSTQSGCRYFDLEFDDEETKVYPACIVGHVFSYSLDETVCRYIAEDNVNEESVNYMHLDAITETFTPLAIEVMVVAQETQDTGGTWGEAYADAKDFYEGNKDYFEDW